MALSQSEVPSIVSSVCRRARLRGASRSNWRTRSIPNALRAFNSVASILCQTIEGLPVISSIWPWRRSTQVSEASLAAWTGFIWTTAWKGQTSLQLRARDNTVILGRRIKHLATHWSDASTSCRRSSARTLKFMSTKSWIPNSTSWLSHRWRCTTGPLRRKKTRKLVGSARKASSARLSTRFSA